MSYTSDGTAVTGERDNLRALVESLRDSWQVEANHPNGHGLLVQVYGQHAKALTALLDATEGPDTRDWTLNGEPIEWRGKRLVHPDRPAICVHHVSVSAGFICSGCSDLFPATEGPA